MAGEFKGDFTRDTFHAYRHYSSVFQQQGRVSLDADGNEQASILLNLLRGVSKNIIADGDAPANKQFTLISLTLPAGTSNDRDFGITTHGPRKGGRQQGAPLAAAARPTLYISRIWVLSESVDGPDQRPARTTPVPVRTTCAIGRAGSLLSMVSVPAARPVAAGVKVRFTL